MTHKKQLPNGVELWGLYTKLSAMKVQSTFKEILNSQMSIEYIEKLLCQKIIELRNDLGIDPAKHYWAQLPHERDTLPQPVQYTDTEGKEYAHIPDFARQIIPVLPEHNDPA